MTAYEPDVPPASGPQRTPGPAAVPATPADRQISSQAGPEEHDPQREIRDSAGRLAREIKQEGSKMAREVRDRAGGLAREEKNRAAHKLQDVGDSLHKAAEKLDSEQDHQLADYVDRASQSLRRYASSLESKDLDELRGDLASVARRRPEVFLGAAFAGGLALGRFLKASPPKPQGEGRSQSSDVAGRSMAGPEPMSSGTTSAPAGQAGSVRPGAMPRAGSGESSPGATPI